MDIIDLHCLIIARLFRFLYGFIHLFSKLLINYYVPSFVLGSEDTVNETTEVSALIELTYILVGGAKQ